MDSLLAADKKVGVLIVDDQEEGLITLEAILERLGQNLVRARSGREALRKVLGEDFAVILLDVQMPDMDGFETASLIRERDRSRNTPIIFLTAGHKREEQIFRGYQAGAVDYMIKPIVSEILRSKVSVFIELAQASDLIQRQAERLRGSEQAAKALAVDLELKNQELERQSQRVAEAYRLKSEFLANMSHELRTPLNSIIGFSELMISEATPDSAPRHVTHLGHVLSSGKHLLNLINDILDLSKIEAGRTELNLQAVLPAQAIQGALDLLQPIARKGQVTLDMRCQASSQVLADPLRLRQILLNLLSNAIKFSPPGAVVEVGSEEIPGLVRFFVRDRGPGIPEGFLPRLFQAFAQGGDPQAKNREGTGLGLAISKGLVERHGGNLAVRTAPGEGATFHFTLPSHVGPPPPENATIRPEAHPPLPGPAGGEPGILVVDDHELNREYAKAILSEKGYRIFEAEDGEASLRAAERYHPDLILMDLAMQGMDGFTALKNLRARSGTRDIPVLALTASALPPDEKLVRDAGFDGYLTKPIEREVLLEAVSRFLVGSGRGA